MTSSTNNSPSEVEISRAAAQKRRLLMVAAVCGVALAAGALWYGWRWYTTPLPPQLALEQAEESVVEAIDEIYQEVVRSPRSAEAWGKLGMILRAHEYRDQAYDCFVQAERLDRQEPRWPYLRGLYLYLGKPHDSLPHLQRAASLCQEEDDLFIPVQLRLAEVLLELGRHDEAEKHFQQVQALEPDNLRLHYNLGLLALARNQLPAARQHLQQAQQSSFAKKKTAAQLAVVCKHLGDNEAANKYGEMAARLPEDLPWPDPIVSEYMLLEAGRQGVLREVERLEKLGRVNEMLALLHDMVRKHADARSCLALGITLAKVGHYEEAENMLRTVIEMEPQRIQAHYYLSAALYYQGKHLLEQSAPRAEALDKFEEASRYARQTIKLQPNNAFAHVLLGRSLMHLGQQKDALEAFRTAIRCRPEFADPHFHLGEALAKVGQVEEAQIHLQNAVRIAPENTRARRLLEELAKKGTAQKDME